MVKISKFYFYLFVILTLTELIFRSVIFYYDLETFYLSSKYNSYHFLFSTLGCVGLFGYVFKKKMLYQDFWKTYLLFFFLFMFYEILILSKSYSQLITSLKLIDLIFVSIDFIVFTPLCFIIFKYGFKSNEIWLSDSHTTNKST